MFFNDTIHINIELNNGIIILKLFLMDLKTIGSSNSDVNGKGYECYTQIGRRFINNNNYFYGPGSACNNKRQMYR